MNRSVDLHVQNMELLRFIVLIRRLNMRSTARGLRTTHFHSHLTFLELMSSI